MAKVIPKRVTKKITEAMLWISPVFPESILPIAKQYGRIAN